MNSSPPLSLSAPLNQIPGLGKKMTDRLARLGVERVGDLFELLPFRLEDRTNLVRIVDLAYGQEAVIAGKIKGIHSRKSKKGILIVQADIEDESGKVAAVWFNQRFLLKLLREGQPLLLLGTRKIVPTMKNPFFVKKIIPRLEVCPIYPATAGLGQQTITRLLKRFQPLLDSMEEVVPASVTKMYGLKKRSDLLQAAHFNPTPSILEEARHLLGFEELLGICINALTSKKQRSQTASQPVVINKQTYQSALDALSFDLTTGQVKVLEELIKDMGNPYPMTRLLYGEVGSGKTAVALILSAVLAAEGRRTLWLSPTTTLAYQQSAVCREYCRRLDKSSALVMGSVKDDYSLADVIVGTHALLHKPLNLDNVGLIIIDEQHRFGVEQRNALLLNHQKAHLLMMTATPIPRSLAQTLFGHIDISFLEGRPTHQHPVKTVVFTDSQRPRVEEHIRKRIAAGHPGYVICPLIEGGESMELFDSRKALMSELERLQKEFPHAKVRMLHGKMKAAEKEGALNAFKNGEVDILLATSVVEVGIDNPEASWILVEEADFFGLSQLHQLRGRIGRGSRPSVCFLHNSQRTEQSVQRLRILSESSNGMEIAENDLRLRGMGNIAGVEQSGLLQVRYADLSDTEEIKKAYEAAKLLVQSGTREYVNLTSKLNVDNAKESLTV